MTNDDRDDGLTCLVGQCVQEGQLRFSFRAELFSGDGVIYTRSAHDGSGVLLSESGALTSKQPVSTEVDLSW